MSDLTTTSFAGAETGVPVDLPPDETGSAEDVAADADGKGRRRGRPRGGEF